MLNSRDYAIVCAALERALHERTPDGAHAIFGPLVTWVPEGPEREAIDIIHHLSHCAHDWRDLATAYSIRLQIMAMVTAQEERLDPSPVEFEGDHCPGCDAPRGQVHKIRHREPCLYEHCGKCGGLRAGCVCDAREDQSLIHLLTDNARRQIRDAGGPNPISRIP